MADHTELAAPMVVDVVVVPRPCRQIDLDIWASRGTEGLQQLRRSEADGRIADGKSLEMDPAIASYWANAWAAVHAWSSLLSALCLPSVGDLVDVSISDTEWVTVRVRARRVHGRAVPTQSCWSLLVEAVDVDHDDVLRTRPPTSWDVVAPPAGTSTH